MYDSKNKNIVLHLTEAVSEKLGRPARCRKVLNHEHWYIYDPVFSFIQRGMQKGLTGYRVGYCIDLVNQEVMFQLVHSPIMAKLFKRNIVFSSLISVIRSTSEFRRAHWIYRSSKDSIIRSGSDREIIESKSLDEFIAQLEEFDHKHGFVKDLFPKCQNTGKGGGIAPHAGNTFYLGLMNGDKLPHSYSIIRDMVDKTWPLFLCLYPIEPIEKRSASLARNMRVRGISKRCEFSLIQFPRGTVISPLCRGEIQGAHIKPDSLGGSDRPENGIWLCEFHHGVTEGKLVGKRNGLELNVRYEK